MIENNQLKQLIAIEEYKTISKASEMIHMSQPALSRSIQRMEDELEVSLFTREKNKMQLNENGLLVLDYAKKIINLNEEMISSVQKLNKRNQTITIGTCAPAPLWEIEPLIKKAYPQMNVETHIEDISLLIDKLYNDDYQIIITNQIIDDPFIESIAFIKEELYFSLPLHHPFSSFKEISFDKVNGQSVLMLSQVGIWYDICKKMLPDSLIIMQDNSDYFMQLRESSSLPAFSTNITISNYHENDRVFIPITDDIAKIQFYIHYKRKNRHLFSVLKEF